MTITAPPIPTSPTITSPTVTASPPASMHLDDRRAVRSRRDDLRAIPTVLKSEWIKLSSLRANKVLFAFTIVVNVFTAWAVASWVTDQGVLTASRVFVYPGVFTAVLAAVAGILLFTSEAQHGTLATSLTAQPSRWVIAVSKMMTVIAVGIVFAGAGMVAGFFGALLGGLALGETSGMAVTGLYALLFVSLAALIGLSIGMIARHSAAAIAGLLVWWFVGEKMVRAIAPATVSRYLPFDAGYRTLGAGGDHDTPAMIAAQLARPQLALIFATYATIVAVIATVLLYRRDNN